MNGIEKAKLQEEKGVRPIVNEIDNLRIALGNDNVFVCTPKVETNLRSAKVPPKSMTINCLFHDRNGMELRISFPVGYPCNPLHIEVSMNDLSLKSQVQELIFRFNNNTMNKVGTADTGIYPTATEIINEVLRYLDNSSPAVECDVPEILTTNHIIEESNTFSTANNPFNGSITNFSCRKCRQFLFNSTELHPHSYDKRSMDSTH